jgi:predicted Zn-dependent protease with MMP-like domain
LSRQEFEAIVQAVYEQLPPKFKDAIENVGIVVEDYPDDNVIQVMNLRSRYDLLGLYQGIPLPKRGVWYGMSPTMPDRISIYQKNIERVCRTEEEVKSKIHEVVIHEIGHYFGMTEDELRAAGY